MFAMRFYLAVSIIVVSASCHPRENHPQHVSTAKHHHRADGKGERYADGVNDGTITTDTLKGSPRRMVMANVGNCHVHIDYGSPGVKGRTIWGGLVPFGEVWVSGAHAATTISFSSDVQINGSRLSAGEYALFTIPDRDTWTLIFNSRSQQHLTDEYSKSEDVLRLSVLPDTLSRMVPRLTYQTLEQDDKLLVSLSWEYIRIAFTVTADR